MSNTNLKSETDGIIYDRRRGEYQYCIFTGHCNIILWYYINNIDYSRCSSIHILYYYVFKIHRYYYLLYETFMMSVHFRITIILSISKETNFVKSIFTLNVNTHFRWTWIKNCWALMLTYWFCLPPILIKINHNIRDW